MTNNNAILHLCKHCNNTFPRTSEFFHKANWGDGLQPKCKTCVNANTRQWKRDHADEMAANAARWREENPDKVRDYIEANRPTLLKQKSEWLKSHPENNRIAQAKYYGNNKPKVISRQVKSNRRRAHNNPSIERVNKAKREARKHSLPCAFTTTDWESAQAYFNNTCAVCGRIPDEFHKLSPDHWIPLSDSRSDNPGTVPLNLVPLCHATKGGSAGCNNSKGNRDAEQWLIRKFGTVQAQFILARVRQYFAHILALEEEN